MRHERSAPRLSEQVTSLLDELNLVSEHLRGGVGHGEGAQARMMCTHDLKGIVAKRLEDPYGPGPVDRLAVPAQHLGHRT